MKLSKLVTKAVIYNREMKTEETRTYVGRHTKVAIEKMANAPVVEIETVKAIIEIPDEVVNQYMTIQED